jgi:hypothetical protein
MSDKITNNLLKLMVLGMTTQTFKAAVYDYISIFDTFNFDEFYKWLTE